MSRWNEIKPPSGVSHCKAYLETYTNMTLFVGKEHGRWHLSIAHPKRYPTWDEIRDARYLFVPNDVFMMMHLPPKKEYVNVHPNCFQLHEACETCANKGLNMKATNEKAKIS